MRPKSRARASDGWSSRLKIEKQAAEVRKRAFAHLTELKSPQRHVFAPEHVMDAEQPTSWRIFPDLDHSVSGMLQTKPWPQLFTSGHARLPFQPPHCLGFAPDQAVRTFGQPQNLLMR